MSKKISEDVKNAIDRAIDINVKMEDLCVEVELMSKKYSDETSIFSYAYRLRANLDGLKKSMKLDFSSTQSNNKDKSKNLVGDSKKSKNKSLLNVKDFVSKNLDENGCLRLSDSSVFEDGFFADTEGIKEVIISVDVNKIPENFFSGSKDLKKVVILSEHIKEIGKMAFDNCENLREIILPEGLRLIGKEAFSLCFKLQKINLPKSLRSIGRYAFHDCGNLREINLPEDLRSICKNAFNGCKNLKKIKIPDKVEVITNGCFYGCKSLSEIILPENLREIRAEAFSKCDALDSITVRYSVYVDRHFAANYDLDRGSFTENCVEIIRTGTEEEKREFEEKIAAQNSGCLGVIAVMILILWICV